MLSRRFVPALALGAAIVAPALARPHFSLRNDFSTTENPSGAWAYLHAGAPITCALHQPGYIPELTGWCCQQDWGAAVAKLTSAPTVIWHDAMITDVVLHVSSSPAAPIAVRWTAPDDGVISMGGVAWDASFGVDRDAGWTLLHNQTVLAERNTIVGTLRTDLAASFHANLADGNSLSDIDVAAGDTITFTTYNLSTFGHFMGVDIGIDFEPAGAACPGDTNGDGVVDFVDLNRVLSAFGTMLGDPGFIAGADLNGDDQVDFQDLNTILTFFGQSC